MYSPGRRRRRARPLVPALSRERLLIPVFPASSPQAKEQSKLEEHLIIFFPLSTLLYEELECEMEEAALAAGSSGARLHTSLLPELCVYV